MGRKVFVSSDMSTDDRLVEVAESDPQAALLWPWLLTAFDDWGRSEAAPKMLKAKVFPSVSCVSADDVARALETFADAGLIDLYFTEGKQYMAIPMDKWFRHQTQIPKAKRTRDESRFPAPTAPSIARSRENTRDCARSRENTRILSPSPSPSPSGSPFASLRDCGDAAEPDGPGADAPTTAEASNTDGQPDADGQPSGDEAGAPCWESWPLSPERDFCRLLGLDTNPAVDAARVWAQFGQMRRLYGPGMLAEAVLSADLKSPPGGWPSPQDALRYIRGAAKGEKARVGEKAPPIQDSAPPPPAASTVVDHAAHYVALAVEGLGPDGRPLEPEPPPAGPFVLPPWSKRAKAAASGSRSP